MLKKLYFKLKWVSQIMGTVILHPILSLCFLKELMTFLSQSKLSFFDRVHFRITPYLLDKTEKLDVEPHYTYHTAWAARRLRETAPEKHVDISSNRFFATLVSAFVPMDYYEYRPADLYLSGLESKQANVLNLPFADNSIDSLSCMHVVEHIGLGRYGDPVDCDADKKAALELQRVLSVGGNLFFVVPIGKAYQVQFNGQRIYAYEDVLGMFPTMKLREFSLIPDDWQAHKGIVENASPELASKQNYGCGCFIFTKV